MSAKKRSKTVKGRATKTTTKDKAEGSRKKADTDRPQPRNDREQQLVDYTLEHAEEIRAARGDAAARAVHISPHYTHEQGQQIEADGERFKADAIAYAKTAYDAALAHFEKHNGNPFALSRLAIVFGETQPGDTHMVITLPGLMRDSAVSDEDVYEWTRDAELLARTLEHRECPEAFKSAFGAIYTEHLLDGSRIGWTSPDVLRVMLPLVMLAGSGTNHVCDDHTALSILKTLSSELMSDHAGDQVRAFLHGRRLPSTQNEIESASK